MPPQVSQSHVQDDRADEVRVVDARVTFTASAPFGLRVRGRGSELICFADRQSLIFTVPLRGLTTGISTCDKTMHDLLATKRFPTAELRVPRALILIPRPGRRAEGTAEGAMTLRGTTARIEASYKIGRQGGTLEVTGSMRLPVDTWGVVLPRHMGFALKSLVPVKILFSAPARAFLGCDDVP